MAVEIGITSPPTAVDSYLTNFMCYPDGHFAEHSAEELKLTEEERLYLIDRQVNHDKYAKAEAERRNRLRKELLESLGLTEDDLKD